MFALKSYRRRSRVDTIFEGRVSRRRVCEDLLNFDVAATPRAIYRRRVQSERPTGGRSAPNRDEHYGTRVSGIDGRVW